MALAWAEAYAATLPPAERPAPEVVRAFGEAYVAIRTRPRESPEALAATDGRTGSLLLGGPPPRAFVVPDTDTVITWGKVFLDLDADSTYDEGEPGLPDVEVSNGNQPSLMGNGVKVTRADGTFDFLTPLPSSRFVFVTVPSGYTATSSFFHRLTTASPDTAYFGLVATPETADPVFRWVQISDMQVSSDPQTGHELSADLTEIEELPSPPDFIVVTGDLTGNGSNPEHFQTYLDAVAGHPTRLHQGYGNHDTCGDPLPVANFETYIGPTCYSFEHGGVHFVVYNDIDPVDAGGQFTQAAWLFQDLTLAHGRNLPIVVCKHTMPLVQEVALYYYLGVSSAFSGHWHGSRVRLVGGIFDINTPPIRYAGIDKSSRGFRINDMDHGAVATNYRLSGLDDHVHVAIPADGDSVVAGPVTVRVNAYDSVDPFISGSFVVNGPDPSGTIDLAADGPWAWRGTWNAASAADGTYTLTATMYPEAGGPVTAEISFSLVRAAVAPPDPYTDWPCFKHDPAGTGYTPEELPPPLRLVWVRHLGGRNNIESPVVANGRVYVGTSNISTVNEAALNCFDAASGDLRWRFPARTDVKCTPAVADGRVFFTNSIGTMFALDAATGGVLWTAQLGDSTTRWEMTSPTVAGDRVYVGGLPAMSAFDAATGDSLWRYVGENSWDADFTPAIYSAPAVSGETVVFTNNKGIFAFDRGSGALLWRYQGASQQHRSAAIRGDVVYSAGGYFSNQQLLAYDLATGQVVRRADYRHSESTSAPAVTPSRVIAVHGGNSDTGALRAVLQGWQHDLGPNLLWNFEVGAPISSSRPYQRITGSINSTPAVAANVAYFGADDGRLYAVDITTGSELWRFDLGVPVRSSPAIAGNMLFVTAEDGSLYAFVSTVLATAGTQPVAAAPLRTRLLGNHPDPFNPATTIAFDLGGAGDGAGAAAQAVLLRIYDPAGRAVRTLVDRRLAPGHHAVRWDGLNADGEPVVSGVYFCRLEVGEQTFSDRLVVVR